MDERDFGVTITIYIIIKMLTRAFRCKQYFGSWDHFGTMFDLKMKKEDKEKVQELMFQKKSKKAMMVSMITIFLPESSCPGFAFYENFLWFP